jgi:hypothetical protein
MFRLSGNCRRELGKKALDLNGNAVIGVQQYFDLERYLSANNSSQKSITVRSIGTAVKIVKIDDFSFEATVMPLSNLSTNMPEKSPSLNPTVRASSYQNFAKSSPESQMSDLAIETVPTLILPSSNWRAIDLVFLTIKTFPRDSILAIVLSFSLI